MVLCLVVAGCAGTVGADIAQPVQPYHLSEGERGDIENGIRQALKDPDSARFEGIRASQDAQGIIRVCGFVNAKNSFGGFTGRQPFNGILSPSSFTLAYIGSDEIGFSVANAYCTKAGIPLL